MDVLNDQVLLELEPIENVITICRNKVTIMTHNS